MPASLAPSGRPRSPLGPLVAAGACVLGLALLMPLIPLSLLQKALSGSLIGVNVLVLVWSLQRAVRDPAERRGWLALAGSIPLTMAANVVLTLASPLDTRAGLWDWVYFAMALACGVIQAAAILLWPWRRGERESRFFDGLGSLLFSSSFFLLLWLIGIWQAGFQDSLAAHARTVALAGRLSITSGVAIYYFTQDPRRVRGPLGWVMAGMGFLALTIALLRPLIEAGGTVQTVSPLFALALLAPFCLAMAARSPRPVEVPPGQARFRTSAPELVPYVPFLIAGTVLGVAMVRDQGPLIWPLLMFLAITGLLVLRQFLLLRELRRSHARLEERVATRTRALERMQAAVLETERMNALAILGAGLAHDLNNMLATIRSSAELLQMELDMGRIPDGRALARIVAASAQAGDLTRRLMAFGRKGPEPAERGPTDLAEALGRAQEVLRMMLPNTIRLRLQVETGPCRAGFDPRALEQVLVNLVSNARDAMPEGGEITLRLREDPSAGAVHLEVSDTGTGIPPDIQGDVFDVLFTTKPEGKGTGLGLPSVRALVEAHGGRVEMASRPGQGTTFRLVLPLAAAPCGRA